MNRYRFRAYYQFNGPSHSNPFRTELTKSEIQSALDEFPNALSIFFGPQGTTIEPENPQPIQNSCIVNLVTNKFHDEVIDLVSKSLNSLDLYGEILSQPPH